MLQVNYKIEFGEIKYRQSTDGQLVTIKIHWANALCAFIHHYKDEKGEKYVQLISFFADEQHIKNCEKNFTSHDPVDFINGKVESVKLNLYYPESKILLKHIVKYHNVTCYYKEPKK